MTTEWHLRDVPWEPASSLGMCQVTRVRENPTWPILTEAGIIRLAVPMSMNNEGSCQTLSSLFSVCKTTKYWKLWWQLASNV